MLFIKQAGFTDAIKNWFTVPEEAQQKMRDQRRSGAISAAINNLQTCEELANDGQIAQIVAQLQTML